MYIKSIELFHIAIPLKYSFETSFGKIDRTRPALIIKLTSTSGISGYGESSVLDTPISEPETTEDALRILQRILPVLVGIPVSRDINVRDYHRDRTHPVSCIGIEAAYLDLVAKTEGVSIGTLFGATRPHVAVGESVGLKDTIEEVIEEVRGHVGTGIKRIKIKIAHGKDIEIIDAVRKAFPYLVLGVDANAAYLPDDIAHLQQLASYNVHFVEQPFAVDDYDSHAELKRAGISVCLDETVRDVITCLRAIDADACDMINIKPARIGSFAESRKIHDLCVERGIKLFGGGRMETGIGKTMNAHFYALPGFTEPSDITPPQEYLIKDIITPPFYVRNGEYVCPNVPGIGVDVSEMETFTLGRYAFR